MLTREAVRRMALVAGAAVVGALAVTVGRLVLAVPAHQSQTSMPAGREGASSGNQRHESFPSFSLSSSAEPARQEPDSATARQRALDAIVELAADPEDPDNPPGVSGVTDEALSAVDPEKVAAVVERGLPYAKALRDEPRFLFALGRAALVHGDRAAAKEMLDAAASAGSMAAQAYGALLLDDVGEVRRRLASASTAGFAPAAAWLEELEAESDTGAKESANRMPVQAPTAPQVPAAPPTPERSAPATAGQDEIGKFNRPDFIQAFRDQAFDALDRSPLESMSYLIELQSTLADSQVLFLVQNPRIRLEVDPQLATLAGRKLMTSHQTVAETVGFGIEALFAPFMQLGQARQGGGSLLDEVVAMNRGAVGTRLAALELLKQQAVQDAQRLALMYDDDPDFFRRVYSGMRSYVRR